MSTVASIKNLSLSFGQKKVLNRISFELEEGLTYGLLGRNGAGKTSLLSALTGLYLPDPGSVIELFGQPLDRVEALKKIHFSRSHQSYGDESIKTILRMAALAHEGWDQDLALKILKDFNLTPDLSARKLSDGQKSGLGIALAIASNAPLTIMDEPYSGLDPLARNRFYDLLREAADGRRRTFLLATHLIDEAAPLLDHILMLGQGEILLDTDAFEATTVAHEIAGSADAINVYLARSGLEKAVVSERAIGSFRTAQVAAPFTEESEALAASLGVNIQPISLQDSLAAMNFNRIGEETI